MMRLSLTFLLWTHLVPALVIPRVNGYNSSSTNGIALRKREYFVEGVDYKWSDQIERIAIHHSCFDLDGPYYVQHYEHALEWAAKLIKNGMIMAQEIAAAWEKNENGAKAEECKSPYLQDWIYNMSPVFREIFSQGRVEKEHLTSWVEGWQRMHGLLKVETSPQEVLLTCFDAVDSLKYPHPERNYCQTDFATRFDAGTVVSPSLKQREFDFSEEDKNGFEVINLCGQFFDEKQVFTHVYLEKQASSGERLGRWAYAQSGANIIVHELAHLTTTFHAPAKDSKGNKIDIVQDKAMQQQAAIGNGGGFFLAEPNAEFSYCTYFQKNEKYQWRHCSWDGGKADTKKDEGDKQKGAGIRP